MNNNEPKRVLVIEDHVPTLELWCDLLSLEGYICTPCNTGHLALEEIRKGGYGLVLCDVNLPDINGFNVKAKLNNDKVRIPLIFITGLPIKDGVAKSRQLGAIRFLTKPVPRQELLDVVAKAFEFAEIVNQKPELKDPKALLVIYQGNTRRELEIARAYTVGRSKDADIKLLSNFASKEHGVFIRVLDEPDNYSFYQIVDYSLNGIEVNGKKIKGYQNLHHKDRVQFPGCEIHYFELEDLRPLNPYTTMPSNG